MGLMLRRMCMMGASATPTPPLIKTVTGSLLHITDALAKPAKKFTATLEPIQDLHGQDAPYPSGGGKNLLPYPYASQSGVYNGVTFTIDNNGKVSVSGTATAVIYFNFRLRTSPSSFLLKSETYIVSGAIAGLKIVIGKASDNTILGRTDSNSGRFTVSEDTEAFAFIEIASGSTVNGIVEPMIRLASVTDATFAPYENNCPITGHTGANVVRTGMNVWDEDWEVGGIAGGTGLPYGANDRIRSKNFCPCKGSTAYYLKNKTTTTALIIWWYDGNKAFISNGGTSVGKSTSVTSPSNARYFKISSYSGNYTSYANDYSINYPSTDTDYHAYSGTTIPITFPSEAGTVYGGTLTNEGGEWKLRVEMASVDMGTLEWTYNSGQLSMVSDSLGANVGDGQHIKCSIYKVTPNLQGGSLASNDKCIAFNKASTIGTGNFASGVLVVKDTSYSDAATFKTAMSGVQLVYELATPIDYTLSESQALTLLKGTNNVWCDASDDLELQYYAKAEETP